LTKPSVKFVGQIGMVDGEIAAALVGAKLIVKPDYRKYSKELEAASKKAEENWMPAGVIFDDLCEVAPVPFN